MLAAIVVIVGIIGYKILAAVNSAGNGNDRVSVIQQLSHLVLNRDVQLKGESQDRVNILLLGIGGEGHDGPLLTDTMIVASLKPSTGQVALLSVPRDLAVDIPRYGIRKINSANAYGKEMQYPGGGEQLSADIVAKTLGISINYYARMDFTGFQEIIDNLGGITVNVEHSFSDYQYPTNNYGYQTIKFSTGSQHMNGDTALKYVRSRHGNNGEGSDFARSRRQQLVLEAVKSKFFSAGTLFNAGKIGSILSSLGTHTRTNMEIWELLRVGKLVQNAGSSSITTTVLDNSAPNGLLKDATGIDGAYLLLPKDGTFRAVQAYAKDLFIQHFFSNESAHIVIRDESGHTGGAQTVASSLESLGFPTPTIDTSAVASTDAATSLIDYTNGSKQYSLQGLQDYLKITAVSSTALDSLQVVPSYRTTTNVNGAISTTPDMTDFVITIGKDFFTTASGTTYDTSTYLRSGSSTNVNTTTNGNTNKNSNVNSSTNKNSNKNTNATKNTNINKNGNVNAATNSNVDLNTNTSVNTNTAL